MSDSLIRRATCYLAPEIVGFYSNVERRLSTFRDRVPYIWPTIIFDVMTTFADTTYHYKFSVFSILQMSYIFVITGEISWFKLGCFYERSFTSHFLKKIAFSRNNFMTKGS